MTNSREFIADKLKKLKEIAGQPVFLVGGLVREVLLNKKSYDFDFTIADNSVEIALELAKKTYAAFILLDESRKTARVVWNKKKHGFELNFDIALFNGNNIEADLQTRDLTINAMAIELNEKTIEILSDEKIIISENDIIDPCNGISDLKHKLLRTVSRQNFADDPLRMLRTFRFSAKLGFKIEKKTSEYIKELSELIKKPARERVLKELRDIFSSPVTSLQLRMMKDTEILYHLLEGFKAEKDKVENAINLINILEVLDHNQYKNIPFNHELTVYINKFICGDYKKYSSLKFSLLFIAIKSPETDIEKYLLKLEKFLREFSFSKDEFQLILKLTRFAEFYPQFENFIINRKNVFHFFQERGSETNGVLLLNFIQAIFYKQEYIENRIKDLFRFYYQDKLLSEPPQLIDGNEIIKAFSLKPGRLIGDLLDKLKEAQAEKKVSDKKEAMEFISSLIN